MSTKLRQLIDEYDAGLYESRWSRTMVADVTTGNIYIANYIRYASTGYSLVVEKII